MSHIMELTRKALESVRFQTKGKWYRAQQVDELIEEIIIREEEASRSRRELEQRCARLERELAEFKKTASRTEAEKSPLEQEQEQLLKSIKQLRRLRDEFRRVVKSDAQALLEKMDGLESDGLL